VRKIIRGDAPFPPVLQSANLQDSLVEMNKYFGLPPEQRSQKRVPINEGAVYNSTILDTLKRLFANKCAFCESFDVEMRISHYRPISNAHLGDDYPKEYERYFWFSYQWENFLPVCGECFSSIQNRFPILKRPAPPLSSWAEANTIERPLLLDPCQDNPKDHLYFTGDGHLHGLTERGKVTINLASLDRSDLERSRSTAFKFLEPLLLHRVETDSERFIRQILKATELDAPHSGAISIFIENFFKLLSRSSGMRVPQFSKDPNAAWQMLQAADKGQLGDPFNAIPLTLVDKLVAMPSDQEVFRVVKAIPPPWIPPVSRIRIEHFKGIENLEIEIPTNKEHLNRTPCLAILGENAAGKSSILQAIALCQMRPEFRPQVSSDLDDYIPRGTTNWDMRLGQIPNISVEMGPVHANSIVILSQEKAFASRSETPVLLMAYGARRYFNGLRSKRGTLAPVLSMFDPLATIANPLPWLGTLSQDRFEAVARAVRIIMALGEDDYLDRSQKGGVYVHAFGRTTPIEKLSEGYKSVFCMTVDIARNLFSCWDNLEEAKGLVLIDELETHLHPRWKLMIAPAIRKAFPSVQFIVTTHDPLCLNGFSREEILVLTRGPEGVLTGKDLPQLAGLGPEQLLVSDYFGLPSAQDPESEVAFGRFCTLYEKFGQNDASAPPEYGVLKRRFSDALILGTTPIQTLLNKAIQDYLEQRKKGNRSLALLAEATDKVVEILSRAARSLVQ